MYYVLLSGYNNYYNRIYKRENTIQEYIDASSEYVVFQDGMNFEYRDGISTDKLFNCGEFVDIEPNYLLLKQNATDTEPLSRWFVVEWVKVRGNQYRAILRRDLLADHYEEITESPCFIEKGWVPNTDSAIFNKENMTFNQIKQSEKLLIDESKTSWIVGYIAQDHVALSNKEFTVNPEVDVTVAGNFTDWVYHDLCDGLEHTTFNVSSASNQMRFLLHYIYGLSGTSYEFMFNATGGSAYENNTPRDYWWTSKEDCDTYRNSNWRAGIDWNTCLSKILLDRPTWTARSDFDEMMSFIGKKVQFQDGVYEFTLTQNTDAMQNDWSYWANGNLYDYLYGIVNAGLPSGIQGTEYYPVAYKLFLKKFTISARQVTDVAGTYKYSIPQTVKKLEDAPYKMFAIPYYREKITTNPRYQVSLDGSTYIYCDDDLMMSWAMDIAKQFGDNLYDLQILPYCPLSNWRGRTGTTNAAVWAMDKSENVDYVYLTETVGSTTHNKGFCFFCDVSTKEQILNAEEYKIVVSNYKVSNETEFCRLCSPNYASAFEFSPAKNGGVQGYNVRYTYKPYQPFVNVAPIFSRLYGEDFKDNRGLILNGDFSLPIVKDAWINYQLNNKNYLLTFDRQIENMEVNYDWQRKQGIANAITGTIQGGASGMMAGGMVGGVWGAVAGAVVGTGTALAGGVMDVTMQQALHNEALDYARDNFGYQLGNIQALPNTLNKVSSIVANSKLFPFVEYYTCTDEERQALVDKIKYNGMSIGRIGHILDFKNPSEQTYIKGQIIRLEGEFDTHTSNEIANEFMKGWYI